MNMVDKAMAVEVLGVDTAAIRAFINREGYVALRGDPYGLIRNLCTEIERQAEEGKRAAAVVEAAREVKAAGYIPAVAVGFALDEALAAYDAEAKP